jgi:hypothetical protein
MCLVWIDPELLRSFSDLDNCEAVRCRRHGHGVADGSTFSVHMSGVCIVYTSILSMS